MIPSGKDAWKSSQPIREWFEVVFDTNVNPSEHTAYVCKSCWEQFDARTSPINLEGHALGHSSRAEKQYSRARVTSLSGEAIVEFHGQLLDHFDIVTPEAGTWKFECKACKKRIPHRMTLRELLEHGVNCLAGHGIEPDHLN